MTSEYDGRVHNIDFPCPANIEIQFSVITEEHFLGDVKIRWDTDSGGTFQLDVAVFEKYVGDEECSDVPVIKYLPKEHSPACCGSLRLRPVTHYRNLPAESRGVRDALEGCRASHEMGPGSEMTISNAENGPPIMRFDASGAKRIDSCHKTFLYCCSLYDRGQTLTRESATAMYSENYTHGSVFQSSKELACFIAERFGATIGKSIGDNAEVPEGDSFSSTYVWIVHGPVKYVADPSERFHGIQDFFTKPDIYRSQNEYRFWIGMNGMPAQSDNATIDLPVPPELVTGVELD